MRNFLVLPLCFVNLQVNADVRYYIIHSDERVTLAYVDTTHVGKSMSTKAIGSSNRQDVTDQYKFKEDSEKDLERAALLGEKSI